MNPVKKILNNLFDFIWPQFCLGCNREGSLCCGYCLNDILLVEPKKITWPDSDDHYFDACFVCCEYQNKLVQKIVKQFKYSYLENLSTILVNILEKQARHLALGRNTIITNVPLHPRKQKQRGFDQTEILAKQLARQLNLSYSPLLKRTKATKTQAQLSKIDRQKNVSGVFKALHTASANSGRGTEILLIDDITTTGSTLNQAAKALKDADYQKITCLVLAKN
ncbi:ComF family protein [Candidatus Parcubacteria bacterium]|jgi:competence protein ComFC|nr:ComF family protein [Candidatus Parcubacteria bacterium]